MDVTNSETSQVQPTLPVLCPSGWYRALALKRSLGIGVQLSLPATHRSQNLEAFVASPPNVQLMPTMAIGGEGEELLALDLPLGVPLLWELPLLALLGVELAPP